MTDTPEQPSAGVAPGGGFNGAPHGALGGAKASRDAILARVFAAADAALGRAADMMQRGDKAEMEHELKLTERLARAASSLVLARARAAMLPSDEPEPQEDAARHTLLETIERTLESAKSSRRSEVAMLEARGFDPREAWVWDAATGDWAWDPGSVIARAQRDAAMKDADTSGGGGVNDPFRI